MASDPRVYFAAERTLLAWVRTGISIQGVGFLVAKFGLFLRLMGYRGWSIGGQHSSMLMGVLFVLVGSGAIAWAGYQNRRFSAALPADQLPEHYTTASSQVLSVFLAVMGVGLAVYLAITSHVSLDHQFPAPPVQGPSVTIP